MSTVLGSSLSAYYPYQGCGFGLSDCDFDDVYVVNEFYDLWV